MTTFRLGSSCSAEKCTNVSVRRWEEEGDVEDVADPDRLLQCPYDKNHQIRACRFPYHLIKCQKNHPKLAQELKTCPFNARHLMPKHELSHHIANCVDRSSVNTEDLGSSEVRSKWHVPVNTWENPKCSEDWDKEIEESPGTTFIWGVSTSKLNQERAETRTTNSLPPGLRAPTTLPWKNWGRLMERIWCDVDLILHPGLAVLLLFSFCRKEDVSHFAVNVWACARTSFRMPGMQKTLFFKNVHKHLHC
ncbi:gametocyte-specific factor 1 isoform X2 [Conger conger]|uniref:gametocyte-specific factor 1 isoform X2 n=2 Tax=Conger conger TaxID=82655 RepID=UPI002A5B037C|nr:gametocyte-specific factor 1 isoform X2 [Conger conger]